MHREAAARDQVSAARTPRPILAAPESALEDSPAALRKNKDSAAPAVASNQVAAVSDAAASEKREKGMLRAPTDTAASNQSAGVSPFSCPLSRLSRTFHRGYQRIDFELRNRAHVENNSVFLNARDDRRLGKT